MVEEEEERVTKEVREGASEGEEEEERDNGSDLPRRRRSLKGVW